MSEQDLTASAAEDEVQSPDEYPTRRIWLDVAGIWVLVGAIAWFYSESAFGSVSWSSIALTFSFVVGSSLLFVFRRRFSRLGNWLEELNKETLSSFSTSFVRLELKVRPVNDSGASTDPSVTQELEITLTPTLRKFKFFAPLVSLKSKSVSSEISERSGVQPYESLGRESSGTDFAGEFHSLHETLRKFSMDVEIDVPEGTVNGLCWEALVPRGDTAKELAYEYLPFNSYRKLSLTRRRAPVRSEDIHVLALAEGDLGPTLANGGWAEFTFQTKSGPSFELKGRDEVFAKSVRPEISIIHLVGSIESSSLGLGFRLGEERSKLTAETSKSIDESDSLIRAEDLTRAFPNLSVCILQEGPRQVSAQRLEGDRRDAFFARLFASQMFGAGVPFVLVIPPLRITEAIMAIDHFAKLLARRSRFKRWEVLGAIAELRLQIGRYALSLGVDPVTTKELPQDLCLYLNPEWDGRFT